MADEDSPSEDDEERFCFLMSVVMPMYNTSGNRETIRWIDRYLKTMNSPGVLVYSDQEVLEEEFSGSSPDRENRYLWESVREALEMLHPHRRESENIK